jgi:hypothetical protein
VPSFEPEMPKCALSSSKGTFGLRFDKLSAHGDACQLSRARAASAMPSGDIP